VIGSCRSFDPLSSDFPYPTPQIFRDKNCPKFCFFIHLTLCALSFVRWQTFRKQTTFCRSTMFTLPNDTDFNNFHAIFVQCCLLWDTFTQLTMFTALQSGAIWRMTEPTCGLFSGKVSSVATPSRFTCYSKNETWWETNVYAANVKYIQQMCLVQYRK